jgi:GNAT superfamily N-acetyltransferase
MSSLLNEAYFNDVVVGGVCCRVEADGDQRKLYIMTLGCLSAYRRHGIGTMLFNHVLDIVKKDGNIDCIYLYVPFYYLIIVQFTFTLTSTTRSQLWLLLI